MSNKINIRQEQSEYQLPVRKERVKKIAKTAFRTVGLGVAGGLLVAGAMKLDQAPEPEKIVDKTVQIEPGGMNDITENGSVPPNQGVTEAEDGSKYVEVLETEEFSPENQSTPADQDVTKVEKEPKHVEVLETEAFNPENQQTPADQDATKTEDEPKHVEVLETEAFNPENQ